MWLRLIRFLKDRKDPFFKIHKKYDLDRSNIDLIEIEPNLEEVRVWMSIGIANKHPDYPPFWVDVYQDYSEKYLRDVVMKFSRVTRLVAEFQGENLMRYSKVIMNPAQNLDSFSHRKISQNERRFILVSTDFIIDVFFEKVEIIEVSSLEYQEAKQNVKIIDEKCNFRVQTNFDYLDYYNNALKQK